MFPSVNSGQAYELPALLLRRHKSSSLVFELSIMALSSGATKKLALGWI
jgi:hypothetical protein